VDVSLAASAILADGKLDAAIADRHGGLSAHLAGGYGRSDADGLNM
jgi:hypothetical protein